MAALPWIDFVLILSVAIIAVLNGIGKLPNTLWVAMILVAILEATHQVVLH